MGFRIRQRTLAIWNALALGASGIAFTLAGTYLSTHFNIALVLMGFGVLSGGFTALATAFVDIRTEAASVRQNALAALVDLAHELCELKEPCDLRVTLMTIDSTHNPAELEQVVRCGCAGPEKPGKNRMSIQQGVAGLSLRKMGGKVTSQIVDIDPGSFEKQMVELGFTKEQAKQFKERGSYLCTPIVNSMGEGIAVLCLDTNDPDTFKPEHVKVAERLTPFFARFLTASDRSGGENA